MDEWKDWRIYLFIILTLYIQNLMTILNNKRSFLGSDNKLKYVLSSLGKEKKVKNYTYWRFLKYPPCPTPIDENRGIEEVGGRKLKKKGRYEWGSKSSAFSSRALPLSDNRIGIFRVRSMKWYAPPEAIFWNPETFSKFLLWQLLNYWGLGKDFHIASRNI